jgi:hypothetical protein
MTRPAARANVTCYGTSMRLRDIHQDYRLDRVTSKLVEGPHTVTR